MKFFGDLFKGQTCDEFRAIAVAIHGKYFFLYRRSRLVIPAPTRSGKGGDITIPGLPHWRYSSAVVVDNRGDDVLAGGAS